MPGDVSLPIESTHDDDDLDERFSVESRHDEDLDELIALSTATPLLGLDI